jgi:hypothetical protein
MKNQLPLRWLALFLRAPPASRLAAANSPDLGQKMQRCAVPADMGMAAAAVRSAPSKKKSEEE